jgi:pectinesterase
MKNINGYFIFCLVWLLGGVSAIGFSGQKYDIVVDINGTGNYKSVQEAFNAVPDKSNDTTFIYIKKGVYKEKLTLSASKCNVVIVGEDKNNTILTYDDFAQKQNEKGENIGTTGSSSFFIYGDNFTAKNITFENSAGPVGQAVAVRIDGDRVRFFNCRFLGFQDTLYPHGEKSREYYKNCYVEGTVDFIFGWAVVVFDSCTIFGKKSGYFTAASTNEGAKFGFVFFNCKITGNCTTPSFHLGRPWRPNAKVAYLNCYMDNVIRPEGWNNWDKPEAESLTFFAEYNNSGPGADVSKRVPWAHQLTKDEASQFTLKNIFGDWNPLQ